MYYGFIFVGSLLSVFNKRVFLYLFASVLMLAAFLRYGIGADYFAYQYLYERLNISFLYEFRYGLDNQEVGFRLLGSFLKKIGLSYQQYIMFFAAINLIYVVKTVKKYSQNPTLSLVLYFSFYYLIWTFSGIRQGITIAIGMYYLLQALKKKKTLKLIVITALLSLIHTSAWFILVLYFISSKHFKKKQLYIFTVFCLMVSVLPIGSLINKMTWLPLYNEFSLYIGKQTFLSTFDFQSFGRIVFLIIAFVFYDSYVKRGDFSRKIMNVYIISLALYFALQFSEMTASRLSIYGQYLNIIILANILYLYRKPITKMLYLYCLVVFCSVFLFKNLVSLEKHFQSEVKDPIITPYVNIYNKDDFSFKGGYYRLPEEWRMSNQ